MSFVVDTTILIDHLRGRPEAREWLLNHQTDGLTISVIARAEVLGGLRPGEEEATWALLDRLPTLDVSTEVADIAARYRRQFRKSHGMLLPDALIAGIARTHDKTLVTLNSRDFPMDDIRVTRPY